MAPVCLLAKQAVTGGFSPTALLCVSRSFAAAIDDQKQGLLADDAEAFGFAHSHPAPMHGSSLLGGQLPARAVMAAPGFFIHAVKLALGLAFHLPTHVLSQSVRGRRVIHLSKRLSSSPSSRWIDPNENGLTHAQISFAPGAKAYD